MWAGPGPVRHITTWRFISSESEVLLYSFLELFFEKGRNTKVGLQMSALGFFLNQ